MSPTEAKSIFKHQNERRSGAEPYIYIVRGYDVNNNTNSDMALAKSYGVDTNRLGQSDRLVFKFEAYEHVIRELRHYQLFDYVGIFPRVKPANNTGHSLTNKLSPVFEAVTRLMLNQYYLNEPTHPPCAHSLKPKAA